jgi:hypothetical protein
VRQCALEGAVTAVRQIECDENAMVSHVIGSRTLQESKSATGLEDW